MEVRMQLDWLQFSLVREEFTDRMIPLNSGIDIGKPIESDLGRYTTMIPILPDGRWYLNDDDMQVGSMVLLSGQALRAWRGVGMTDQQIIEHATANCTNITRLDFAVDVINAGKPEHTIRHWKAGKKISRVRMPLEYKEHGEGGGNTFYYGSRKGDRFVRVYDKAAEMDKLWEAWTRIELQARKKRANPMAHDMVQHGVNEVGVNAIKKVVDFPELQWWQRALAMDAVPMTGIPNAVGRWRKWMMEQVLNSIKTHAVDEDDNVFLQEWLARARREVLAEWHKQQDKELLNPFDNNGV